MQSFIEFCILKEGMGNQFYDPSAVTDEGGFKVSVFKGRTGDVKQFILPDDKIQEFLGSFTQPNPEFEAKVKAYFRPHDVRVSWGPFNKWAILSNEPTNLSPNPISSPAQRQ